MNEKRPQRPSIENAINARWWELIKSSWMANLPPFPPPGHPRSGLQDSVALQRIAKPGPRASSSDNNGGVRAAFVAEAVFLFHKCAHAHLAAQRLGTRGMHSWSMFNAYHAAFLGARGVMALLGISIPQFESGQYLIDAFPYPTARKDRQLLAAGQWDFTAYDVVHFPGSLFKQEDVWQAFCRTVHVAVVPSWNGRIYDDLRTLSNKGITSPRNKFLYSSTHWPLNDLLEDAPAGEFDELFGTALSARDRGFLLRLSCDVYGLFQSLMVDLGKVSEPVRLELESSRITKAPMVDDLAAYNAFLQRFPPWTEVSQ